MIQNLDNFWEILPLKGAGRQIVYARSTFGTHLKTVQMGYMQGRCSGIEIEGTKKLTKKQIFSKNALHPKIFKGIFSGTVRTESLRNYDFEYVC